MVSIIGEEGLSNPPEQQHGLLIGSKKGGIFLFRSTLWAARRQQERLDWLLKHRLVF